MIGFRFLGRGAAFNAGEGNTAVCIRHDNELLLLDCGETVFQALTVRGLLHGVTCVTVAVSHFHSDHCGSLGSLSHFCHYALGIRIRLLVPEDPEYIGQLAALLAIFGCEQDCYEYVPCSAWQGMGPVKGLSFIPTEHARAMHCYSFVLQTDEGDVFYSADTCSTVALEKFIGSTAKIAAIYMDTTDADYPVNVHLPLTRLAQVLPPELRSRTWLMHLNGSAVA